MLKDLTIRFLANDSAYERGLRYYREGRVSELAHREGNWYHAAVDGTKRYEVDIHLSRKG